MIDIEKAIDNILYWHRQRRMPFNYAIHKVSEDTGFSYRELGQALANRKARKRQKEGKNKQKIDHLYRKELE